MNELLQVTASKCLIKHRCNILPTADICLSLYLCWWAAAAVVVVVVVSSVVIEHVNNSSVLQTEAQVACTLSFAV